MSLAPPTLEQVVAAIARLEAQRAKPKPPEPAPEGKRRILIAPPDVPKVERPAPEPEPEPPPPPVKVYTGEAAQQIAASIEPPQPHPDPIAAKLREELEARAADEALANELVGMLEPTKQVAPSEEPSAAKSLSVPSEKPPAASSPQPQPKPPDVLELEPASLRELEERRRLKAMPTKDGKPPRPSCLVPDCGRPYLAKQLCNSHYRTWRDRIPELLGYVKRGETPPRTIGPRKPTPALKKSEPHRVSEPIAAVDVSKLPPKRAPQPAQCVADGCRGEPWQRGLCAYHYKKLANAKYKARLRARSGQAPAPSETPKCAECGKVGRLHSKGLCSACYMRRQRAKRRGEPVAEPIDERPTYRKGEQPKRCTEAGCRNPTVARGLCRNHWRAWRSSVRDAEAAKMPPEPPTPEPVSTSLPLFVVKPGALLAASLRPPPEYLPPAAPLDATKTRALVTVAADVAAAMSGVAPEDRARVLEVARLLLGG